MLCIRDKTSNKKEGNGIPRKQHCQSPCHVLPYLYHFLALVTTYIEHNDTGGKGEKKDETPSFQSLLNLQRAKDRALVERAHS